MNPTADDAQRGLALTALGDTLFVEASAGTGKTSLLAGRVVMLMADGKPPSSIAAITFTERAAAELRARVEKFTDKLIARSIPDDLAPAFREHPLREDQTSALIKAKPELGDLTAGTIHAFCLSILQNYAVEARVDPGAAVMDEEQTTLAFDLVLDTWLSERLGTNADPIDPIVVMAADHPSRAVEVLRKLARFRRSHPDARPSAAASYGDAVREFANRVDEFRRWLANAHAPADVQADGDQLLELVNLVAPAAAGNLDFAELLRLLHPEHPLLQRNSRLLTVDRPWRDAWDRADPERGVDQSRRAFVMYEECGARFGNIMGAMADTLLTQYFAETTDLMNRFEAYKRSAAVLDFDDILVRTRALLRTNPDVRKAVAARYAFILVDEFQDTDPIQTEILFLIASASGNFDGSDLRPGALFLVGDPKQAIYRFRGADLPTYLRTRDIIRDQFPGNVLKISANFRSETRILDHVNKVFAARLKAQLGDYADLKGTIDDKVGRTRAVARYAYHVRSAKWVFVAREAEASAIARLCTGLVGNVRIRRSDGDIVPAEPGDIALLAPTGTELWRYERALEAHGLPVASQAGKNLYRRQETQDFIALVRTLADCRDTLALGALLRGPLVGLTEAELLDITQSLRAQEPDGVLSLRREPLAIPHYAASEVMGVLHALWRKRRGTTPHALLSEALERLRAIPAIALRTPDQRARGLANINTLLERSRAYDVRGLKQFAVDLSADWEESTSLEEAAADHQGDSIDIVTIHKAKGLEWPIVIPINLVNMSRRTDDFFFRPEDNSVHWTLGDVSSSSLDAAVARARTEIVKERERLLYVACTRALDLLIIPQPSRQRADSWFEFFDLGHNFLDPLPILAPVSPPPAPTPVSVQSASTFAEQARHIVEVSAPIVWLRPSLNDVERETLDRISVDPTEGDDEAATVAIVGIGARRGIVLHRLMEELIVGLIPPSLHALTTGAETLLEHTPDGSGEVLDAAELASTALRTFDDERLKHHRGKLLAEVSLFGARSELSLFSARADAIALDEGGVPIVAFDWKSDVAPSEQTRRVHKGQLAQYLQLINAPRGAIVYMSRGEFRWIRQDGSDAA